VEVTAFDIEPETDDDEAGDTEAGDECSDDKEADSGKEADVGARDGGRAG
jgi:hypothetical protein